MSALQERLVARIRQHGPLTVADFMATALYDPDGGYYATREQRSGRAGDFFTSVDVGPLFGELLAKQFAEMWTILDRPPAFDLVEAGAGNGRLSNDVLDATRASHPELYEAVRLHLVEQSGSARAAQRDVLAAHAGKIASSSAQLPHDVVGVIFSNELLDALPVHLITIAEDGSLLEVFVSERNGTLTQVAGPPSTPALAAYFDWLGVQPARGAYAEAGLAAVDWTREAARQLRRGFLLFIDYGHSAAELFSSTHAGGTLVTFQGHLVDPPASTGPRAEASWLDDPGERDITAHVNLTAVERAAMEEGLERLGVLDQTYFLLGLGVADATMPVDSSPAAVKRRLAAKTLLIPGGLGSTHKALIFSRGVGRPALLGTSFRVRVT